MGTRGIGALLEGHGIVRNRYAFDFWHVVRGGTLKAGEYQFTQAANLPAIYNRIVRGDVYTRAVTIPEGFNLFDIAQAIEDAQLGSKESFLAATTQDVALIGDLRQTLEKLLPLLPVSKQPTTSNKQPATSPWLREINAMKGTAAVRDIINLPDNGHLYAAHVINDIWREAQSAGRLEQTIIVTDVGQHQMWEAQYFKHESPRSLVTSGGLGSFPASHPLSLGMMGMHGESWVNESIQESDLLLAFGMRFDDRVTGNLAQYAPNAKKIHIEIDPSEIN